MKTESIKSKFRKAVRGNGVTSYDIDALEMASNMALGYAKLVPLAMKMPNSRSVISKKYAHLEESIAMVGDIYQGRFKLSAVGSGALNASGAVLTQSISMLKRHSSPSQAFYTSQFIDVSCICKTAALKSYGIDCEEMEEELLAMKCKSFWTLIRKPRWGSGCLRAYTVLNQSSGGKCLVIAGNANTAKSIALRNEAGRPRTHYADLKARRAKEYDILVGEVEAYISSEGLMSL